MLTEIYIRNYLFVPEQRLRFAEGMTVLSGETGAGKSILVGSISLIFGDSSGTPEAFDPTQPIYLEASFDITGNSEVQDFLKEQGYETDSAICLAREILPGRSTYYLDGRKVSSALLKDLKPLMIDFHHQRDQQRLLASAYQLHILDLYAQNQELRASFASQYQQLKSDLKELAVLKAQEEQNRQLSELYQYQFDELEKAALQVGEDKTLQEEFDQLSHSQEVGDTAAAAAFELYEGETSLHTQLSHTISSLSRLADYNKRVAAIEQTLRDCLEQITDSASELSDLAQSSSQDPDRLEDIRLRLDLINSLLYKHKAQSIDELLGIFVQREAQISAFTDLTMQIGKLQKGIEKAFAALRRTGDQLSDIRVKQAARLSAELQKSIKLLSIPEAQFNISVDKNTKDKLLIQDYLDTCNEKGQDGCQFFFSANRGSDLKPLAAVVSGGELSRILLAIKQVLADRIEEKLMILDEIDAGIGGKTADVVAQFIYSLSQRNRILCITHLAQIAAIAHQQVALVKSSGGKRTTIQMIPLMPEQRLAELARMLSGDVSDISLQHAEELINKYKI